jgi:hypothetical protein
VQSSKGSEATLDNAPVDEEAPLPMRQILIYPVIISIANYASVAFLEIMLSALLPLFFAMPVEIGGLGFDPPTIGFILGAYGIAAGLFNVLCFVKIVRLFGVKWSFVGGVSLFLPMFTLMPIINLCARTWGVGTLVWTLVLVELSLMVLMETAFGGLFLQCQLSIGIFKPLLLI